LRFHLPILVALSTVVHVGVIANSSLTARDSLGFARQAMNLAHPERGLQGTRLDVLRETQQPPGYPVTVYVTYCAVSGFWNASIAEQLLLSAQVASAVAGILIVFPFYRLARCLLEPGKAFAAVALYQLLPAVAKYTSDGLSESLSLLFIVTSLWLTIRGLQEPRWWRFLLAGLAAGCAYLVRPEGLGVSLAIIGTLVLMAISERRRAWIISALCVLLGTAIPAVPYMTAIGGITNKPAAKELYGNSEPRAEVRGALFAEFIPTDDAKSRAARAGWCAKAAGIEFLRATHYGLGILAFAALCLFGGKLLRDPGWFMLVAYGGILLSAVLVVAGFRNGYISDRHLLSLVPIACLLAMRTLSGLPRWWIWIAVAIAVSCAPSLTKPLHENRVGHKHAGRFLKGVMAQTDALIDPFEWAGFYTGRTIYDSTMTYRPTAMYTVLDDAKGENPHARLQHMPEALQVSQDLRSELVFTWPPNATERDAKVRVYRLKTYR
jgi:hypothetical protein